MMEYTRITVPLSQDEFEALRNLAFRDYRHPREQARFLLRHILLGEQQDVKNKNGDALVSQAGRVAISA